MNEPDLQALLDELRARNLLRHLQNTKRMLLFGWENFRVCHDQLEGMELIRGEWTGSLDYGPRPMWTTTGLGEQVLRFAEIQDAAARETA